MSNEQFQPEQVPEIHDGHIESTQVESLFEQSRDVVVTMFGMTGKISDLINECPIPASERSFSATEAFTAKALELSNVEIPEAFAHLRTEPKAKSEKLTEPAKTEETVKLPQISGDKRSERSVPQQSEHGVSVQAASGREVPAVQTVEVTLLDSGDVPTTSVESSESAIPQQGGGPPDQELEGLSSKQMSASSEGNIPPKLEPKVAMFIKRVGQTIKLKLELPAPQFQPILESPAHTIETNLDTQPPARDETNPPEDVDSVEQLAELYYSIGAEVDNGEVSGQELPTAEEMIADSVGEVPVGPLPDVTESTVEEQFSQLMSVEFPDEVVNPIFKSSAAELEPETEIRTFAVTRALPPVLETVLRSQAVEDTPEAELLVESIETMTLVVERLQELCGVERADCTEALQIEQVLIEYYEQLCAIAHHEVDPAEQNAFITALKTVPTELYEPSVEQPYDDGTHEYKHGIFTQSLQPIHDARTTRLAHFIMQIGTVHFAEQIN